MLYYLTFSAPAIRGHAVVMDREPTLTDDQLESLRRELYGNQPDQGPDVDLNGKHDVWRT